MPTLRLATVADAPVIADLMLAGMATYSAFAPAGWAPPARADELARIAARMAVSGTWCLLAEEDGAPLGHVAFLPGPHARPPTGDSRLAHLWMLFVAERAWGTGLATELLRRAVREARLRGYAHMRLFSAARQGRARRFYERQGWSLAGEAFDDPALGLAIVEYRLELG